MPSLWGARLLVLAAPHNSLPGDCAESADAVAYEHSQSADPAAAWLVSCLVPGPHDGHTGDPTAGKAPVVLSDPDPRVLQLPWPRLAPKLEV